MCVSVSLSLTFSLSFLCYYFYLSLSLCFPLFLSIGHTRLEEAKKTNYGMADKLKIKINWSNEAIKGRIQAKNHCNDKTTGWLETSPQLQLSHTGLMLNDVKTNWSIAFFDKTEVK